MEDVSVFGYRVYMRGKNRAYFCGRGCRNLGPDSVLGSQDVVDHTEEYYEGSGEIGSSSGYVQGKQRDWNVLYRYYRMFWGRFFVEWNVIYEFESILKCSTNIL